MGIYDKSGIGIPELPVSQGGFDLGGVLSGVAGILSPAAGLASVGGMMGDGMFGSDSGGMDMSSAAASGTFYSGPFTVGKSDTLIIVAAVLLGLYFIFRGKKK